MTAPAFENVPAPNVAFFTPKQSPPAGTAIVPQPDGKPVPTLFKPVKIRGLEMQNRIVVRTAVLSQRREQRLTTRC